ncbi:alkaline phosphatase [Rhodovulum marinum]|uniref:Alkaline phosphatase n=1 Tax=Rhodovulum marinum TaxID=320662 RepID=A0A4R2Q4P0_9RHOB|nr:alkaline phosphatase [Rhodovulum marinum]TCP42864.1 alkaline phosphatase [Rhodovulum marinum]
MSFILSRRALLAASASLALAAPLTATAGTIGAADNVFLFISDGASWGTWDMASYWQYGEKGKQPYDGFDVKMGMTTEPASATPRTYDPDAAWDTTATGDADYFAGYKTIKQGATDSAAAGTALATGEKTYNGRIDVDTEDSPLPFISQAMKEAGKSVGVLSSVPISHATPATFGAQNISRNNYTEIANQMIMEGTIDVLMGGGNPLYDDEGNLRTTPRYNRISEADWTALNGAGAPMTLIQAKDDFEAIANGTLDIDGRVIGMPQVGDTLQANRDATLMGSDPANPSGVAFIESVPTLETMTRAALNLLGDDPDGMFLMVEGGAVDWAAHANDTGRIIEEQVDFNNAVAAAIGWIEANSSWEDSLMIVLTDHGNGMPMGPDSDTIAFQPIENNGAGNLPGVLWHHGTHTTENTLLWAHGAGSDLFADHVVGTDPFLNSILGFNDGSYIQNNAVGRIMADAAGVDLTPVSAVPLPAGIWLFGSGLVLLAGLRRRAGAS